jgi:hypothetical protein
MSKIEVNQVDPQSGTTLTLGTSGDTISIPAGVTLANSGTATGFASIAWQSTIVTTSTLTAVAGNGYWIDTTSNACTVTLPASASVGDQLIFTDYARTWGTNAVTIDQNGLNYQGSTSPNPVYDTNGETISIVYSGATQGWIPVDDGAVVFETAQSYDIDFLVVAGGASGGVYVGGGGGAGGYRTSTQSVTIGTAITVTVGGGGARIPTPNSNTDRGNDGSDSSISGSGVTTITSAGGGGGGVLDTNINGKNGGSGGGSGKGGTGGTGNTPSTAPSQGNNGGNGIPSGGSQGAGGGGGAGAVGANGSGSIGGNGGNGTASSITGSSVTYAGGGGGSVDSSGTAAGTGGTGGGGNGAKYNNNPAPTAGTANTGGGGGGGNDYNADTHVAGGSGVVILSMPLAEFSGTTTGSPTESDDGTTKVLIFNGSGSYTA